MKTPNTKGAPRLSRAVAALLLASVVASASAQDANVRSRWSNYLPGEDIFIEFSGGPGNTKDWVGVYPRDTVPGSVGSTVWRYVDNTGGGNVGNSDGEVSFPGGLNLAGDWDANLLENDGYTVLAKTGFAVIAPFDPHVRPNKPTYTVGEAIVIGFTNTFAGPADWIGIYPTNVVPGSVGSTIWAYLNGGGNVGVAQGEVSFPSGLTVEGEYVAYYLLNDGYDIGASEHFRVVNPAANQPKIVGVTPANNAAAASPKAAFTARVDHSTSAKVAPSSVKLTLDGTLVAHTYAEADGVVTIGFAPTSLFAAGSVHTYTLSFSDDATPPADYTQSTTFTVVAYQSLSLPTPLFSENFDGVAEGGLPDGWVSRTFTSPVNFDEDAGNLDSLTYSRWSVINASRFTGPLAAYSAEPTEDYKRVLLENPRTVVNGQLVSPLGQGGILFGNSGYRNDGSQYLDVISKSYDLTGKTDIFLYFHSLWEQNQDSVGGVEYSIDNGASWLPVVYYLNTPQVLRDGDGNVDAVATFETVFAGTAVYFDPDTGEEKGGNYGDFLLAPITQALASHIVPGVDDSPTNGKRVELLRLPMADNQANVRLRFFHAGTDSWYFGVDNVALHSVPTVAAPVIATEPSDREILAYDDVTLAVAATGVAPLEYAWYHNNQAIPGATSATLTLNAVLASQAGEYKVVVKNAGGSTPSRVATLTVNSRTGVVYGLWDFANLDLTRGVGTLEFAGQAGALTTFGMTDGAAVPHIDGAQSTYMNVPAFTARADGYLLSMPTTPNGGGGYLNQYSMVWDIHAPSINWLPFFNSDPSNGNDADFYVSDTGALGIGALGYSPAGGIQAGQWYRVAFVANLTSGRVAYYVNGQPVRVRTGGALTDGRFALYTGDHAGPDVMLFSEPSGAYTLNAHLSSFLFVNRQLSAAELAELGGPKAGGIAFIDTTPAPITVSVDGHGGMFEISWAGGNPPFKVLRATSLGSPTQWIEVAAGLTTRTHSLPATGENAVFFQVVGQ